MTTRYDFSSAHASPDPFPLYHGLRTHDPVYQSDSGYWYVSRYADANSLLRDGRLTPGTGVADSFGITSGPLLDIMTSWLMALDGPEHTRVRRMISRAFSPRAVAALRPTVQYVCDDLVGHLVRAGGGEIVADLAFPLPMEIVRVLFGAGPAEWDTEVTALFDPRRSSGGGMLDQMSRLIDYFYRFVPSRRSRPGDDMFSAMVVADDDGDALSDLELVANAVLLVTAGFETTMGLLSLVVLTLLRHPDQLGLLRRQPELAANAVEEVLRFEPAALSTTRSTPVDIDVGGTTIPAGSNILFSVVAANRDPDRYPDPDRFDITRPDIRPLTFGGGAHACIGAALSRLEAEVALQTILRATANLTLITDPIVWQADNPTVRRPVELRVSCAGAEG